MVMLSMDKNMYLQPMEINHSDAKENKNIFSFFFIFVDVVVSCLFRVFFPSREKYCSRSDLFVK